MSAQRFHRCLGARHSVFAGFAKSLAALGQHVAKIAPALKNTLDGLAHIATSIGQRLLGFIRGPAHLFGTGRQFLTALTQQIGNFGHALRCGPRIAVENFRLMLNHVANFGQARQRFARRSLQRQRILRQRFSECFGARTRCDTGIGQFLRLSAQGVMNRACGLFSRPRHFPDGLRGFLKRVPNPRQSLLHIRDDFTDSLLFPTEFLTHPTKLAAGALGGLVHRL